MYTNVRLVSLFMNIAHLEDQYLNVLDVVLNKLQVAIWQKRKLQQQLENLPSDDEQRHQMMGSLDIIQESIIHASNALITFSGDFEDFIEQHRSSHVGESA